jgi:hypothetical protein
MDPCVPPGKRNPVMMPAEGTSRGHLSRQSFLDASGHRLQLFIAVRTVSTVVGSHSKTYPDWPKASATCGCSSWLAENLAQPAQGWRPHETRNRGKNDAGVGVLPEPSSRRCFSGHAYPQPLIQDLLIQRAAKSMPVDLKRPGAIKHGGGLVSAKFLVPGSDPPVGSQQGQRMDLRRHSPCC